ncbi:hypothetical protein KY284_028673 [Solanum tuberosum]|nr:hypothetical protein KY284_028673 [Solanum tuberosum]
MAYRRSDFAFPGSRLEKGYSISAAMLARKGLKELTLGRDLRVRVRNGKGRMSRTGSRNRSCYRISILLFNGKRSNEKFSSAGKQSFTDMGAYSAVAGLEWIERKAPGFLFLGVNIGMGAV